ncbi:NAD(P)-binding protein [Auriscalpium vulgare]|uniref:NAD(P)-binding protein n=1 Tax=Auriscalpium vulgare TaxID=40419 RepID=A0ACB8RDI3_9AGAM|nr:NAD(P)-binding protein [Auriscalpium vulgare]
MTTIHDNELLVHSHRAREKVLVITGAASGIGRETALLFARHGSKVVLGDVDIQAGEAVAQEIREAGGEAAFIPCDVLVWDEQVALFDLAISRFGAVDIVIPNAGVPEIGSAFRGTLDFKEGRPVAPKLRTIDIDLTTVLHTVHLGMYYIKHNRTPEDWKAFVLLGSMASWIGGVNQPQYTVSKHGLLGLMRSLHPRLDKDNVRISVIHPWFANTKILPPNFKKYMPDLPLVPLARVAGAIFLSVTDPNRATNGCPWVLPDGGPVFRLDKEKLTSGVYGLLNQRVAEMSKSGAKL